MRSDFIDVLDVRPPRFGRIRWVFARAVLWTTNRAERLTARVREWALNEAVASSPTFDVFEAYVTRHFAERGIQATVTKLSAEPSAPIPQPTVSVRSAYLN